MKISTQKIAFIAIMSAFCVIGRLGMLALPNVQPITVVVIWMTLELGWGYGASISILSILISNMLISMGPWTLYQMISFSIVCLCATLLSPLWKNRARYPKVSFLITRSGFSDGGIGWSSESYYYFFNVFIFHIYLLL